MEEGIRNREGLREALGGSDAEGISDRQGVYQGQDIRGVLAEVVEDAEEVSQVVNRGSVDRVGKDSYVIQVGVGAEVDGIVKDVGGGQGLTDAVAGAFRNRKGIGVSATCGEADRFGNSEAVRESLLINVRVGEVVNNRQGIRQAQGECGVF